MLSVSLCANLLLVFLLQSYHKRYMGVYKVFNSSDLMFYFTKITFASFWTEEEPIANITVYILSCCSFLLDTDSFIFNISKGFIILVSS